MIALILAAGASTRYGGNKVLTRYRGKSLIEWNISFAVKHNIKKICITINDFYGPEIIEEVERIKNFYDFSVSFKYQDSNKYGPAAAILPWVNTIKEDFLLLLGDNYYEGKITWELGESDCVATYMTFTESDDNLRFSYITQETKIIEKPHNYTSGNYYIGFMAYKHKMLKNLSLLKISTRGEYELTDFFNTGTNRRVEPLNMHWFDIASKENLEYV